jgi:hypothetical protein
LILNRFTAAGALLMTACSVGVQTGPTRYESQAIDLDKADRVRVELRMGAGELRIGSGTEKLMQAYFTYNVPSWKPVVNYAPSSSTAELKVEQPSGVHSGLNGRKYEWDLRFNDQKPLDLAVHFGAGQGQLDLGRLNLRSVEVHMGVGQMELDLRGQPKASYSVDVHGGIGQATVRLPSGVGVEAHAAGGIGHIEMRGLTSEGGSRWVNRELGHSPITVRVNVNGGIGEIRLLSDTE